MKHSDVVGGSTVTRLLACPGSATLIKQVPKAPGSSFAAEGSMLHDAIESLMLSGPEPDPCEMIGFEAHGHTLDFDHAGALMQALHDWNTLADAFEIDDFDCEVYADWTPAVPGAGGSIDVIGTGPTHNMVLDWKFGRGIKVVAKNNKQGRFYAAGAMLDPQFRDMFNPDLPTVIAIVQPRVEDGTSFEVVQPQELRAFIDTVAAGVKRSTQPDAPLETGKHCRFCPAVATCPKKLGQVESLPAIDSVELGRLLGLADEVETWVKSVRTTAKAEADRGHIPAGYKLVKSRTNRKWDDEKDAEKALRGAGYRLKVAQICERRLKSPPQVEKILKPSGKKLPDGTLSTAGLGTSLVHEDDKRSAIPPIANALQELAKL